jgi:hypothetical protein
LWRMADLAQPAQPHQLLPRPGPAEAAHCSAATVSVVPCGLHALQSEVQGGGGPRHNVRHPTQSMHDGTLGSGRATCPGIRSAQLEEHSQRSAAANASQAAAQSGGVADDALCHRRSTKPCDALEQASSGRSFAEDQAPRGLHSDLEGSPCNITNMQATHQALSEDENGSVVGVVGFHSVSLIDSASADQVTAHQRKVVDGRPPGSGDTRADRRGLHSQGSSQEDGIPGERTNSVPTPHNAGKAEATKMTDSERATAGDATTVCKATGEGLLQASSGPGQEAVAVVHRLTRCAPCQLQVSEVLT